ncbi:glycoside hydrolase family 97 catalytic domain-containing protein [uncultured Bacteroides sp.]|uniref:glycoside hydrolase family 97 protein n=1 Tax=uncultured Bacteroides sp. TaxID=162156 RepID=UPI002AABF3E7|nr:glycoside hydrolase family 97 catalytic domain-containing protein [uncultured Bacteroides sp.]
MKVRIILQIVLICLFLPNLMYAKAGVYTIKSPNKQICVELRQRDGGLVYSIKNEDEIVLDYSKLGIRLNKIDLSDNLSIISALTQKQITDKYSLISGKKANCIYYGNERTFEIENANGNMMDIIFRVSNDGVAFRYVVKNTKKTDDEFFIKKEFTTFNFKHFAKTWLHPREKAGTGWCHTQPSYEENFQQNISVGTKSLYNEGWTFPALFKTERTWVLLSETDVSTNYCASHLSNNVVNGEYSLAFPDSIETTTDGDSSQPHSKLDWATPWRLMIIGTNLGRIVESTLSTDLAFPSKVGKCLFAKSGIASWSWALLNDSATIFSVQKDFIDYAATMKWLYCLIDAMWDTQIGYNKIRELSEYAKSKNVGLWLWYNSVGNWNDTPQTPRDKLIDPGIRKNEFERLHEFGIKGIKVDFFPGEGQSVMKYQQDILKDAATYELMVNFHGSTFPRGWTRTYPNLMSTEAVKGFEYRTFNQMNENVVASHCCMLPFTRNVVAPMDFTPLCFSEIKNIKRTTSNAFELALPIIFESGVQHYVETPDGMKNVPEYVRNLLTDIPAAWDDIKFIDGYPGEYVVLARKKGNKWYLAGINGKNTPITLNLDISFMKQKMVNIISDGHSNRTFSINQISILKNASINIQLNSNGGFIIY